MDKKRLLKEAESESPLDCAQELIRKIGRTDNLDFLGNLLLVAENRRKEWKKIEDLCWQKKKTLWSRDYAIQKGAIAFRCDERKTLHLVRDWENSGLYCGKKWNLSSRYVEFLKPGSPPTGLCKKCVSIGGSGEILSNKDYLFRLWRGLIGTIREEGLIHLHDPDPENPTTVLCQTYSGGHPSDLSGEMEKCPQCKSLVEYGTLEKACNIYPGYKREIRFLMDHKGETLVRLKGGAVVGLRSPDLPKDFRVTSDQYGRFTVILGYGRPGTEPRGGYYRHKDWNILFGGWIGNRTNNLIYSLSGFKKEGWEGMEEALHTLENSKAHQGATEVCCRIIRTGAKKGIQIFLGGENFWGDL